MNVTIIGITGQGVGAALIGYLNDVLAPTFGQTAIRYSMSISVIAAVWCAFHAMMAARTIRADAEKTAME